MSDDPDNLVLAILREMRAEMGAMRTDVTDLRSEMSEVRSEIADVRSEVHSLRADVASDLMTMRKDLGEQIVGLRRAVLEYHTTVIGHGVLISDLEGRVRRIEQRIGIADA